MRGPTSIQEILAPPAPRKRPYHGWTEHHRRLLDLRDWFLGKRNSVTENARCAVSSSGEHMADAAADSYDRDYSLAILSSAQNALYEIDQALDRIARGTYGVCELSGKPIEANRLKAIPWARFSTSSQAKLEAHSSNGRTQLGELGTYLKAATAEDSEQETEETLEATKG